MSWTVEAVAILPDGEGRTCTVQGCQRGALFKVRARQGQLSRDLLRCVNHAAAAAASAGLPFPPVHQRESHG